MDMVELTARHPIAYHDRGVVGLGLGGSRPSSAPALRGCSRSPATAACPPSRTPGGRRARSVRGALTALHAVRIRHGIRAVGVPGLVRELAERGTVSTSARCPTWAPAASPRSPTTAAALVAAGVACSLSTDDPAMFGADLDLE